MEKKKQSIVKEHGSEKIKYAQAETPIAPVKEAPKVLFALDTKLLLIAVVGILLLVLVTYNSNSFSDLF